MYRVETHNNSRDYFSYLYYEDDAVYITSNSSLSNMMIETAYLNDDRWRVLDIENFINCIYPVWGDKINQIKLKAELRLILLDFKKNTDDDEILRELKFLEENITLLHSDFIFLFEAGLKEIAYKPEGLKFTLLKQIYNRFIDSEQFKKISREILNPECFNNIEDKLINLYIKNLNSNDEQERKSIENRINKSHINKVYFYNINFLDVNRYLLVEGLKKAGYEVVFRIPYFENLNVVNKNWNMIYKDNNIFDFHINDSYSDAVRKNIKYLEFIEGEEFKFYDDENVTVKNYREIYDFKKDVKNNRIITFNKDSLKSCMKRNELNIGQHCYQSAFGRFIFNMYNCTLEGRTIKMSFDIYREMITSGWVEYKEWNGTRLSSYLFDNQEYFTGVQTIDEIIERIESIKEVDEVGGIFEDQVKNRIKKDKTKAFLSNPFRAFGYANLERYNITANYMLAVTRRLKGFLLKALEGDNEILDIENHFKNMTLLFRSSKYLIDKYKYGSELEKKILRKIYYIIKNPDKFGDSIHKDEIRELFNSYLYINTNDEDQCENDFSIDQLEGIIHRDKLFKSMNEKKLYIADMSYKAYEDYMKKYSISGKILNNDEIKQLFEMNLLGEHRKTVLQGIKFKEKSNLAAVSYLKFALANLFINFDGKLEFSWISEFRDNDSKSILLKQIESIYENTEYVHQNLEQNDLIDEKDINEIELFSYDKKHIESEKKKLPEVAFRDLDFCGTKFEYSSIIEDYPIYYSDFHHKLLFSGIVSILKNNIEDGYINICRYVFPLFPQWEDVVKKNILDCEYSRKDLTQYKFFEGINYPKNTDILYLLKSRYIVTENSKIRNRYNKGEFDGDKYYNEFIDEYLDNETLNEGRHCMMCPHCYVCRKGEFIIDNK